MQKRRFTDEEINEIIRLVTNVGKSFREVGIWYGVSTRCISYIIRKAGYDGVSHVPEHIQEKIVKQKKDGATLIELESIFKYQYVTFINILLKHGIGSNKNMILYRDIDEAYKKRILPFLPKIVYRSFVVVAKERKMAEQREFEKLRDKFWTKSLDNGRSKNNEKDNGVMS